MCGGGPCFNTFFGIPLQLTVIIIGVIELIITIVATILNVVKYAQFVDPYGEECAGKDVCYGPLIKYSVFDAFFGVVCALLLILGAHTRNHCMLLTWMVITFCISLKYIWVVVTHDWTSLEVELVRAKCVCCPSVLQAERSCHYLRRFCSISLLLWIWYSIHLYTDTKEYRYDTDTKLISNRYGYFKPIPIPIPI
jgi:hypothetical protein